MFTKAPRIRPAMQTVLTVAGLAVAIAAVPASASAAIRTGSVQDPQGDASALSGPVLDVRSIAVRYDDAAGTIRVTWTYYNDVRDNTQPSAIVGGSLITNGPLVNHLTSDNAYVAWNTVKNLDGSWPVRTTLQVMGVSGSLSGAGAMSEDGRVVTAEFTAPILVGRDLRKGQGGGGGDDVPQFWEQLSNVVDRGLTEIRRRPSRRWSWSGRR
jgi:hypothetical protein